MSDKKFIPKAHEQVKVFDNNGVINFQIDQTPKKYHTIRIEGSKKVGDGYDHSNKISLQVSQKELPLFISVLMGWKMDFKGHFHGEGKNKGYDLENGQNGLKVRLFSREFKSLTGFLDTGYNFEVVMLASNQLAKNHPGVGVAEVMAMLRASNRFQDK